MENSRNTKKIHLIDKILLSFCGAGLFPYAPGTIGTLAAIPFGYALLKYSSSTILLIITAILTLCFSFFLETARKKYNFKDPGWVVIDEVLGYFTAIYFLNEASWINLIIAAILFRVFDISKVWPASYFDKKVKHGSGIILDDIVAGLYSGLILKILTIYKILP